VRLTRRGRIAFALFFIAALLGLPALAGTLYLRSIGVLRPSEPGRTVTIEVPEGASATEIGELLERKEVIASSFGFRVASYLEGGTTAIQAGEYHLSTGLSARDALDALAEGPKLEFVTVTFPEGSWLTDFATRIDAATDLSGDKFLALVSSAKVESSLVPRGVDTLEGLLFPSTYQVDENDTVESLGRRLAAEMEKQVARLDLARVEDMGYSPYDVVNIASMVQAEAGADEDRPKIARVIYNRLDRGMALGIDATIIYATGEHKSSLTQSDLAIDSPYNTRQVAGLPPTPIGAPGVASLRAAAGPAPGDWLYYVVSDCEGHHAFSVGYDDFLRDKAAYESLSC
jgi:UPF0755 protein